ncbi:beta-N-acetylhexosaminidase [Paenibacillus roseipurpureus]|uniref:beta-N-acetylhexosaminidase n=1 Tax=Paenibacillus roseopurpureus TaxID=2918901 RepID=A0AA96RJS3_9BACL|nr:beta-N-acetylhexosaminidase [Paenibacillus sp. MBLB1832]WNR45738.1 beta-N-acetylhexosaminidase [Paenibacillus sp. MBLB1832]
MKPLLILFILLLSGCQFHQGAQVARPTPTSSLPVSSVPSATPNMEAPSPTSTATPKPTDMQGVPASMTLDEKLGQMVIAGIDGFTLNEQARELITTYHVGGIILYKPNVKDTKQLVDLVNELKLSNNGNPLPLWLGVDEEGGRVTRLPDEITKTPSSQIIGKTGKPAIAHDIGQLLGKELLAYGLNMDFAPDLDVNSNPKNPVIGDRSFGANATTVSTYGIPMMKGLQEMKVVPVVKHFPGHGDTSVDSHVGLPVVQNDLARLRKLELVPFAEAIRQQADAIMVAHILLPKIDSANPASMSKKIMTDLLRQELGFQGLIMTDDMTMGAIAENYNMSEAAQKSVLAGSNVVMVGHDPEKAMAVLKSLKAAVQAGTIPMATIDQSVAEVVRLKRKYLLQDRPVVAPDPKSLDLEVARVLAPIKK